jgi:hypothetical protein
MSQKVAMIVLAAFIVAVFSYPLLWGASHLLACGWKGIFVECRIVECSK